MDQKPAGTSTASSGGSNSPASAEPPSSRRRAGGQKRKASVLQTSTTSSTPAKRFVREKAAIAALPQTPIHNGPFTRASRHGPNNFASLTPSSNAVVKVEEKIREAAAAAAREDEESKLEKLEAAMEKEFEVVRSRGANAHVVPNHCGWFSWTTVHPLEEHSLPSFFNGKSQTRTPDVYMKIRNWIVKKFHSNPSRQIELKDLSELEVADMDARQEVLEFLDYWGMINFHPLLENDSDVIADGDKATKKDSLLESLFRFEAIQPCRPVVTKLNLTNTAVPSGLFPESAIAEELARLEGPSVEYHCNSCAADCSRKRYHCQKQADYDLCAGCFTDGKFDSNMAASDFILMESAEAPGASGGKWTDQETLLLLEALELYKENWNEIAEHVATKTKAQCILHFVQMPIEDVFLDSDDNPDVTSKESTEGAAAVEDTTTAKEIDEKTEGKVSADEVQPLDSQKASSNPEDKSEVKNSNDTVKPGNDESLVAQKTLKSECAKDIQADEEMHENIALKALSEAFEAVGYPATPGAQLSFTDVGNPVMALAGFLARLVGADVATASARSSLKCLSGKSPGLRLATKHCFLLEDPMDDGKTLTSSDCVDTNMIQGASKDNHIGENKGSGDFVPEEKAQKVDSANDAGAADKCETEGHCKILESSAAKLSCSNHTLIPVNKSGELSSKQECLPNSVKELQDESTVGDDSQPSVDIGLAEKGTVTSHVPTSTEKSKDVNSMSDSLPSEKSEVQPLEKVNSGEQSHPTAAPMDADMSSPLPSALNTRQQTATKKSTKVEGGNEITAAESSKADKKEKSDLIKDDQSVEKVRRAAVSALSAAAVKAKLLANQEEDHIQQLAASLVEKQLHKLEMKLAFFNEMDGLVMRVREQLDRSRQKLYHERAQIIASRLGIPASSSRGMPPTLPMNRMPMNNANSAPRPPMPMMSQRPPMSRPVGVLGQNSSNLFPSSSAAGGSMRPSGRGNVSSVGTK